MFKFSSETLKNVQTKVNELMNLQHPSGDRIKKNAQGNKTDKEHALLFSTSFFQFFLIGDQKSKKDRFCVSIYTFTAILIQDSPAQQKTFELQSFFNF